MIFKIVLCLLAIILNGCCDECYGGYVYGYTSYRYNRTDRTASGIGVDASRAKIVDLAKLDARVDAIEACLRPLLRQYAHITDEQRIAWGCWPENYADEPIKRGCFTVTLVDPVQGCLGFDLLPDRAPDASCTSKGLTPTDECPCRFREVIQGSASIITTSTRMPLWDLVSIVTGCAGSGVWTSPFAACMADGIAY